MSRGWVLLSGSKRKSRLHWRPFGSNLDGYNCLTRSRAPAYCFVVRIYTNNSHISWFYRTWFHCQTGSHRSQKVYQGNFRMPGMDYHLSKLVAVYNKEFKLQTESPYFKILMSSTKLRWDSHPLCNCEHENPKWPNIFEELGKEGVIYIIYLTRSNEVCLTIWHSEGVSSKSSTPISTKLLRNVDINVLKSSYWTDSSILLLNPK